MVVQAVTIYREYRKYRLHHKNELQHHKPKSKPKQYNYKEILKFLNISYVLTPYLGAAILAVVWILVFPSGFVSHFGHSTLINYKTIVNNATSYFYQVQHYMPFPGEILSELFMIICLAGYIKNLFRYPAPAVFLILTILLFIVWPHYRIVIICFVLIIPVKAGIITKMRLPDRKTLLLGPTVKESSEMFDFIRNNTSEDDIIGFFRPRVMYLYTGRKSLALFGSSEEIPAKTDWYVCTIDQGDFYQYNSSLLKNMEGRRLIKEVFRNDNFVIYSTKP